MFISHIEGEIIESEPTRVVIDSGGIGYEIKIPISTFEQIKAGRVRLFITMMIKNEVIELFGFYTKDERRYFESLLKVRGIGGETALRILSSMRFDEFKGILERGDVESLASVKGIGRKRGETIIFEMKGLFVEDMVSDEALSALVSLGFTRNEAMKALSRVSKSIPQDDIEALIKEALKNA
ncbi:Holliday junction branch migration protein RuvA [candidate division WOR-3 bacterium]|nr:Holliday junction branch migration protein RuvA [candidate division WOR-3 bacterium]